ncbi:3'(2'),5'-bisphosphate nucleotidase CysQ [Parasphingopyxis marina]|uniref:3'(2'),5'-bisphosphate nucleotidase CysQ n=1 Tax=Parasphingopyxis marina TaxID=2761622 RepID=A0A842I1I8_9SPHN|nr:3'(2'),5'-bisphosphate nucleotidase CysQ [Parasphingopyxis marina]MBC2778539.1 3'(2'),5'-bisphosphate nucleotidase CysQ [Parasphingopyxis marina]
MPDISPGAVAAVAAEAASKARERWQGELDVWEKEPGHPVSDVDLLVDDFLRAELYRLDPGAGYLSEETIDDGARLGKSRVWVVDPIDGTRDFIRERTGWCVSVALIDGGQPVIGVLEAPARGERWLAAAGQGATRNGKPIAVSGRTQLTGARVPAHHVPKADADLICVDQPNSIALRIAMVAAGEADILATLRWGHEWDVGAAALIASEAGATVTDALGAPLIFNTHAAEAFGVLVTTPGIHAAAVERLRARAEALVVR